MKSEYAFPRAALFEHDSRNILLCVRNFINIKWKIIKVKIQLLFLIESSITKFKVIVSTNLSYFVTLTFSIGLINQSCM